MPRGPVIAISHGGGPMPVFGDPAHKYITKSLEERVPSLLRLGTNDAPRAIVVITAHWSASNPTISSAPKHTLLFDYYGLPAETYNLNYNAAGSPEIAEELLSMLKSEGFEPKVDKNRGWDHGVFIPMLLINPAATIPIIQLSVLSSEDVTSHFSMGRALAKLRDDNIAIIGSGSASFHNLRTMFSGILQDKEFQCRQKSWNKAMTKALSTRDAASREKNLLGWRSWPAASEIHPLGGGEHFMPLIVCAGAGAGDETGSYCDEFMGIKMLSYYWE